MQKNRSVKMESLNYGNIYSYARKLMDEFDVR